MAEAPPHILNTMHTDRERKECEHVIIIEAVAEIDTCFKESICTDIKERIQEEQQRRPLRIVPETCIDMNAALTAMTACSPDHGLKRLYLFSRKLLLVIRYIIYTRILIR